MYKVLLTPLLLFILQVGYTQSFYIKGQVKDGETQQPLKGASVYINNTTRGAITDNNGQFEIGPLHAGRYEVVASFIGYEPLLYSAELKSTGFRITFQLDKKVTSLREVLILTDETRRKYLEILKKNVLGYTAAADKCRIKNLNEVQFASGESKDEIEAFTDAELEVENPELGYTIYFQLIRFYYNKSDNSTFFVGYTRYVDWAKDKQGRKKWLRKRKATYEGSTLHFFRSLVKKDLEKQGFSVYQLLAPKSAKDSVKQTNILVSNPTRELKMATRIAEDSMIRLFSDSVYRVFELRIGDGWRILYSKDTELKNQILKNRLTGGQPIKGTSTGVKVRQNPVLVSQHGILLSPLSVFMEGMWIYERLANMLPEDYEPE